MHWNIYREREWFVQSIKGARYEFQIPCLLLNNFERTLSRSRERERERAIVTDLLLRY